MTNIQINFDKKTGFYDACIIKKGIVTQGKSLDEVIKNMRKAYSLSKEN